MAQGKLQDHGLTKERLDRAFKALHLDSEIVNAAQAEARVDTSGDQPGAAVSAGIGI
jgi:hypothetical protein